MSSQRPRRNSHERPEDLKQTPLISRARHQGLDGSPDDKEQVAAEVQSFVSHAPLEIKGLSGVELINLLGTAREQAAARLRFQYPTGFERKGVHYTRHIDAEIVAIELFYLLKDRPIKEPTWPTRH